MKKLSILMICILLLVTVSIGINNYIFYQEKENFLKESHNVDYNKYIDVTYEDYLRRLEQSVKYNDIYGVKELLKLKYDIDLNKSINDIIIPDEAYEDDDYYTFLQKACMYDAYDVVKILVNKGADVNYIGEMQESPLIIAVQTNKKNSYKIAKFLIERGANTTIKDSKGKTALDYAKTKRNKKMVDLLS